MPERIVDLSVTETAALVGVSRARVYQRITGYAGAGDAGRAIDTVIRETGRPGTRRGQQMRIPLAVALQWRTEREAAGQAVGEIPAEVQDQLVIDPPLPPSLSGGRTNGVSGEPVGMPAIRPF